MKKLFSVGLLLMSLYSCKTTYVEVYYIEKHPVTWCETIYTDPSHWHFKGVNNEWNCVEIPADTFDIILNDTIVEKQYMGIYKKKEYEIKWNLKTIKTNE